MATEIELTSEVKFNKAIDSLSVFNKDNLQILVREFEQIFPRPFIVTSGGKPVNNQKKYFPDKKPYAYTAIELKTVAALFLQDENLKKQYIASFPADYLTLVRTLLHEHFISMLDVKERFPSRVVEPEVRWSYSMSYRLDRYNIWFMYQPSGRIVNTGRRYVQDEFISLTRFFKQTFLDVLTDGRGMGGFYTGTLPDSLTVTDIEDKASGAYPIIKSHIKQGALKYNVLKATPASSKKILDNLPYEDIFPDYSELKLKYNMGQLYLPMVAIGLEESGVENMAYHDFVKLICRYLPKFYPDELIPALLPYIKGFTAKVLSRRCNTRCIRVLFDALIAAGDKWLLIDEFCRESVNDEHSIVSMSIFHEAFLRVDMSDERVTLGNYYAVLNRGFIQAVCTVLYGLGAVSLACSEKDNDPLNTNPLQHVTAVRLNDLGRYALKVSQEYSAPDIQKVRYFSLDTDRLVIKSLVDGNPYESLLYDTSEPIGNGRFKMDAESFLKHCKDKNDVEAKARFFQEYICRDLPDIWKEFFDNIARRCKPLRTMPMDYTVYKVDMQDKDLVGIISTDAVLKEIVIKAEGYMILVRKKDKETFVSRLKIFGYLV